MVGVDFDFGLHRLQNGKILIVYKLHSPWYAAQADEQTKTPTKLTPIGSKSIALSTLSLLPIEPSLDTLRAT